MVKCRNIHPDSVNIREGGSLLLMYTSLCIGFPIKLMGVDLDSIENKTM